MKIKSRNKDKSNKCDDLKTTVLTYKVDDICFGVDRRVLMMPNNRQRLKKLHKLTKSGLPLKEFLKTVYSLTIASSYYIYLCRNDQYGQSHHLYQRKKDTYILKKITAYINTCK